ncbi:MAG: GNAT family N-acetyltransferase [Gammaproteobacteria bacterium]|nr:GNAT family N-acetyltransferase [Gammaproteobacteria bacterium]MDP2349070.1 GNAT family N-acetyltransferase [Gammaproteobacteria bacterium]
MESNEFMDDAEMNGESTNVRPALISDAREIAEMHIEAWRKAYASIVPDDYLASLSIDAREQGWARMIGQGMPMLWVAVSSQRITGLISFGASRETGEAPSVGELMAIYVHPEFWSCGFGRSLWLAAREELQRRGFTGVMLWVLEDNTRARKFYCGEGFVENPQRSRNITIGGQVLAEVYCETTI